MFISTLAKPWLFLCQVPTRSETQLFHTHKRGAMHTFSVLPQVGPTTHTFLLLFFTKSHVIETNCLPFPLHFCFVFFHVALSHLCLFLFCLFSLFLYWYLGVVSPFSVLPFHVSPIPFALFFWLFFPSETKTKEILLCTFHLFLFCCVSISPIPISSRWTLLPFPIFVFSHFVLYLVALFSFCPFSIHL